MTVILSYGMGVDSTAILLNWLENPETRRFRVFQASVPGEMPDILVEERVFDLSELVVLTAMTGDEFPDLATLMEKHILPRLRKAGVRYVQIARKSKTEKLTVLDDTTAPKKVYLNGAYKLSDELLTGGLVPQYRPMNRRCSIHSKGWPLDAWITLEMGGNPFYQAIGFAVGEEKRLKRDSSFSVKKWPPGQRNTFYPLIQEWGWDRKACSDFIRSYTGVEWPKSACAYCPFAAEESVLPRFEKYPDWAAFSLLIEYTALAMNPTQTLYSRGSLLDVVRGVRDRKTLKLFDKELNRPKWGIYRIRRVWTEPNQAWRSVVKVAEGSRKEMQNRQLMEYGPITTEGNIPRVYTRPHDPTTFPDLEEMFVAAPAVVHDKERPGFSCRWEAANAGDWSFVPQLQAEATENEEEADISQTEGPTLFGAACPSPEIPQGDLIDDYLERPERLLQKEWEKDMGDLLAIPYRPED